MSGYLGTYHHQYRPGLGNTANQIASTASNAAIASGNPYAAAAGGVIKLFQAAEGLFGTTKRQRNRDRRAWRDKAMNVLYQAGVHKVSITGKDGEWNSSIKQLLEIVQQNAAVAIPIINSVITTRTDPASVNQVVQLFNQKISGATTNPVTSSVPATTPGTTTPAATPATSTTNVWTFLTQSPYFVPVAIGAGALTLILILK